MAHIVGVGIHPFGRWPGKSAAALAAEAVRSALASAEIPRTKVEAVFAGSSLEGSGGGQPVLTESGLRGRPLYNFNSACASSSVATTAAASAVDSGRWDVAIVVGYEKMNRGLIPTVRPHNLSDDAAGVTLQPPRYALRARLYCDRYGVEPEGFAAVAAKSRKHASMNPNAHFTEVATVEDVLRSPVVADPLTLLQCCPTSDGAAALVVVSDRIASRFPRRIRIAGWAMTTPSGEEEVSADAWVLEPDTRGIAQQVYEQIGAGPEDVGVAQVHDAFTSGEVVRIEALGLCPDGEGLGWASRGDTSVGGRMPVNTDGGLLSRGHPLGATGAAQMAEMFAQLTGNAGARQISPQPTLGVCQNAGGGEYTANVVMAFSR